MEAFRGIKCSSFWDALVLRLMLEERGVQVHVPEQGVVLSMVASGELDGIKAAVEQLGNEFPHSGSVIIEGEDRDRGAENGRATAPPDHLVEGARALHRPRPRDTAWRPGEAARPQEATQRPADAAQPHEATQRPADAAQPHEATQRPADAAQPHEATQRPADAAQPHEATPRPSEPARPHEAAPRPEDVPKP